MTSNGKRPHQAASAGTFASGAAGDKEGGACAGPPGCSFSGSGPSVFAWTRDEDADVVEIAMSRALMLPESAGAQRDRAPEAVR